MDRETSQVVIQALNQYIVGAAIGFVNDELFGMIDVPVEQPFLLVIKQLGQVAMNGLFIRQGLSFLHGNPPPEGYRDLTGGYLFLMGLYDGQPRFRQNSALLINAMSSLWGEGVGAIRENWAMSPSSSDTKGAMSSPSEE